MLESLAELLRDWHDFYTLIGTASATLVGLMFVAASIAVGAVARERQAGARTFVTPTVIHFGATLVICVILSAPWRSWMPLGVLLLAVGCIGLGYSCWVWLEMARRGLRTTVDGSDRIWYALSPIAGYLLVTAAAVEMLRRSPLSLEMLGVALVLLLLAGIRNAWDITLWFVLRSNRG